MKAPLIFFFILIHLNYGLFSQRTTYLNLHRFHTSNGMSSSNVRKITQDAHGFIWIATQDGLYRFDGSKFTSYNRGQSSNHNLTGSDIRDMTLSGDTLWIINSFGGIDAINTITGNSIYHFDQQKNIDWQNETFLSITSCQNTVFIAGTIGLVILNTKDFKFQTIHKLDVGNIFIKSISISKVILDNHHRLWLLLANKGVAVINSENLKVLDFKYDSSVIFYDCDLRDEQTIIAGTNQGLRQYSFFNNKISLLATTFPNLELISSKDVYAVKVLSDEIYFSLRGYLMKYNFTSKKSNTILDSRYGIEKDWTRSVYSIQFDNEKNIWLGCQEGIACAINSSSAFLSYFKSSDSYDAINHSYFLYPYNDTITLACAEDGLYRVNTVNGIIKSLDKGKSYFFTYKIIDSNLIISNDNGTYIYEDGKNIPLESRYIEFKQLGKIILNSAIQLSDSLYIFGTQNKKGIIIWNYKLHCITQIHKYSKYVSLPENVINTIYLDKKGLVWILSDNFVSIYYFKKGLIKRLNIQNPITHHFYNLFFDIQNVSNKYYIASYGNGILQLDEKFKFQTEISHSNGLSNNGVYKLIPYKDSLLTASTNNGLSIVNLSTLKIKNFYIDDGLQSNEFEELSGNFNNGHIFLGGLNGFTVLDPTFLHINKIPPILYFTNLKIDKTFNHNSIKWDSSNLDTRQFIVSNNWLQANVSFVGLNYSNPTRVTYQYRIKERDTSWIDLGTQNFVTLIGLTPGTYTLEVKASNEDGYWSPVKQLILVFEPKWFQTWWFFALLTLTTTSILYLLYRFRINQVRKQQQIRKDIASDLHDDIGSSLNTVKIFTHLAKREKGKEQYFDEIEHSLTSATIGLRDMIWVLDDSQDTIYELAERIKKIVLPVLTANGIQLESKVEPGDFKLLSKAEKRNLYLIAKEFVNNSIKYSSCNRISLLIQLVKNKNCISIEDNGIGFNATSSKTEGNGLKNIAKRAEQIHYDIEIHSAPGKGTLIQLTKK